MMPLDGFDHEKIGVLVSEYTMGNKFPLICAFSTFRPFESAYRRRLRNCPWAIAIVIGGNLFLFQRTTLRLRSGQAFRLCSRQGLQLNPAPTLYILSPALCIASEFFPQYLPLQDFGQHYNLQLPCMHISGTRTWSPCRFSYWPAGIRK